MHWSNIDILGIFIVSYVTLNVLLFLLWCYQLGLWMKFYKEISLSSKPIWLLGLVFLTSFTLCGFLWNGICEMLQRLSFFLIMGQIFVTVTAVFRILAIATAPLSKQRITSANKFELALIGLWIASGVISFMMFKGPFLTIQ